MSSLHPEALTWTGLLARWIEFAQGSLALPDDAEGRLWRESVPHIINLQAVTFALGDIERLAPEDRPHARDRAEVLINRSVDELEIIWEGRHIPAMLHEVAQDADAALNASSYAGLTELLWPGPETLVMPAIEPGPAVGTLSAMQPGTIAMPGEPVAWWCDRSGDELRSALPQCQEHRPEGGPRQVYRLLTDRGFVRDVIVPVDDEDPPDGFPLLVPLYVQGREIGRFTMDRSEWEAQQRALLVDEQIPVDVDAR